MSTSAEPDDSQKAVWSGAGGLGWVKVQGLIDRIFAPHAAVLVRAVADNSPKRLLDVGCGTGATTVAVALQLSNNAHCVGIDISNVMIDAANERAHSAGAETAFICADAQTYSFAEGEFDLILSRFGIMFFDDPIQAFRNLRKAASKGGKLLGIAWRDPEDNPFMVAAERATEQYLPGISKRSPGSPGQFGFADRNRVHNILEHSGWSNVEILPMDTLCAFPQSDLSLYLSNLGPVGQALKKVDDSLRQVILNHLISVFDKYVVNGEVRFTASCWLIRASNDA